MAMRDSLQSLQEFDLGDLDLDNIGRWPQAVKVIIWLLLALIILFLGYQFYIKGILEKRDTAVQQEMQLRKDYEVKADKAANLLAYREQMDEMEETFGALVRQLPSETDVPGLLEDIDNKAETTGLEVLSVDLQPEQAAEFYIELPIEIIVSGTYHDLGSFVSGVASLPRIVTLHDFEIARSGEQDGNLELKILARTYRYKSEDEEDGA